MRSLTFCLFFVTLNTLEKCRGGKDKNVTAMNVSVALDTDGTVNGETLPTSNKKTLIDVAQVLKTKRNDEIKALIGVDPFQVWKYKSRWKRMKDLKLDDGLMSKGIQAGDSTRLRSVLTRALSGKPVNLLIIGGSNSAGGKLKEDENGLDGLYFKVFSDWWNETIGKATGSHVTQYKETIGGTGSYFFAYCYKTFIPKGKKIDIVLIEASINFNTVGKAEALEQLTQQVLSLPSAPAVLYVNLVSGLGPDPATKKIFNPKCVNLENFGQGQLARHYDITAFSLKEILCRKENNGEWNVALTDMAGSDGRHVGLKAHAQVAMMMITYVRGVFKGVADDVSETLPSDKKESSSLLRLPELLFVKRETEALQRPLCWTGVTPDIYQNSHRPNLQLGIANSDGFSPFGSLRSNYSGDDKTAASDMRTDAQGGWHAWNKGSRLQIRIFVPKIDSGSSSGTRSVTILTRTSGSGAKAQIWLDDDEKAMIYVDSKSVFGNNQLDTIANGVNPGFHTITVRTVRWGMFLVSGVLVGPPDFHRRRVI